MVHFIIIIPFLIFAIVLSKGKGAFLIAGYNTKSEEEKAKYDEVALCKFMGKVSYGICFSIFLGALSGMFGLQILLIIGLMIFFLLIIFTFVYFNTGDRFIRKKQ
ncbi:DUF3784 domain-containing protein [Siminovitchia sediminis]|uniref:DUF3784 domain-containing protein n=1 Tax=Siminovitchia sediminis TaxID=1274353 RepID=A0ABW4KRB5_9BACI